MGKASSGPEKERKSLADAISSFNDTVSDLGLSYQEIKSRIQDLNTQISEKNKQLEKNFYEVNRLKRFFDSILNSMTDGVVVVDTNGRVVLFNRGAEKLTGYRSDEVMGKSYSHLFGKQVSQRFSPLYTLSCGEPLLMEEKEIRTREGATIPVRYSTSLVTDEQGRTLGAVEVLNDLTRLRHLEKEMQQIKTQTALSQMATLVTHEIRNPLGGIRGYVDLIAESMDDTDSRRSMVDHINQSINRLDEIVSNFQLYTRPVKPNFESTDIKEFVTEVVEYFYRQSKIRETRIQPVLLFDTPEEETLMMDPILVEQALLAILDNAAKAMKTGGTLRIHVYEEPAALRRGTPAIAVCVTDSGPGMNRETLEQAFTPFFTTREKGLGLGLALARNFIALHHGDLFIESEEGMGTTVTLMLPKNKE